MKVIPNAYREAATRSATLIAFGAFLIATSFGELTAQCCGTRLEMRLLGEGVVFTSLLHGQPFRSPRLAYFWSVSPRLEPRLINFSEICLACAALALPTLSQRPPAAMRQ